METRDDYQTIIKINNNKLMKAPRRQAVVSRLNVTWKEVHLVFIAEALIVIQATATTKTHERENKEVGISIGGCSIPFYSASGADGQTVSWVHCAANDCILLTEHYWRVIVHLFSLVVHTHTNNNNNNNNKSEYLIYFIFVLPIVYIHRSEMTTLQMTEGMNESDAASALFTDEENAAFEFIKTEIANFEEYERQFQEVLLSLESDDILDEFRAEYAGLHHSFLKSHEGENRLMHKCLDLQSDIYTCVSKAQTAEELSEGDKTTIEHLKAEAERIKKKSASTKDKEGLLKGKIYELKKEVVALEKVSHEPVEAAALEASLQSLQRVHETVLKEKESQEFLLNTAMYEVTAVERRLQKLREKKASSDEELRAVRERIDAKQYEVKEIMAVKHHKEEMLKALRDKLATGNATLSERQARIDQLREDHQKNGDEIMKVDGEVDTLTEEYHGLTRMLQQMNGSLQDCSEENDILSKKEKETLEEMQMHQREVDACHKQLLKEMKLLEALQKRNMQAEAKKVEMEGKRDQAKEELATKELELEHVKEEVDVLQKQLASVHKEQEVLHESFLNAEEAALRNKNWLAEKQSQLYHAEHELQAFENHAQKECQTIYKTMKECGKYEDQTRTYALKCATTIAEVKMKERQIAEAQHRVTEIEIRLRKQQNLLESVVTDRNAYAKHYDQLRHELSEMSSRFQLVLVQITQMKAEVISREREVALEESNIDSLQRQKREIEANILAYQRRCEKRSRAVDAFNNELRKLGDVLTIATEEASRQRRRCRDVIHERDLLDRQSMARAKELMQLCERIHSQMGLLQRGEAMYQETVKYLEQLEYQIASMEQQLARLHQIVDRLPDLRLMVNNATRELNAEKVKVRAMLTECERPINLHPHHELAWSDPETFKVVERVTALQRELARRRVLLSEKETAIQEQESRYLTAKAQVAKQPGPEVSEQLSAYHGHLLKKKAQYKQLQESLSFFREQTEHYRHREEELRLRLNEMAKEYARRREVKEREEAMLRHVHGPLGNTTGSQRTRSDSSSEGTYTGFVAPPIDDEDPAEAEKKRKALELAAMMLRVREQEERKRGNVPSATSSNASPPLPGTSSLSKQRPGSGAAESAVGSSTAGPREASSSSLPPTPPVRSPNTAFKPPSRSASGNGTQMVGDDGAARLGGAESFPVAGGEDIRDPRPEETTTPTPALSPSAPRRTPGASGVRSSSEEPPSPLATASQATAAPFQFPDARASSNTEWSSTSNLPPSVVQSGANQAALATGGRLTGTPHQQQDVTMSASQTNATGIYPNASTTMTTSSATSGVGGASSVPAADEQEAKDALETAEDQGPPGTQTATTTTTINTNNHNNTIDEIHHEIPPVEHVNSGSGSTGVAVAPPPGGEEGEEAGSPLQEPQFSTITDGGEVWERPNTAPPDDEAAHQTSSSGPDKEEGA
eukprot:gene1383-807_t